MFTQMNMNRLVSTQNRHETKHVLGMFVWGVQMLVAAVLMLTQHPVDWAVLYLIEVSLYANLVGHWSGRDAARPTEVD